MKKIYISLILTLMLGFQGYAGNIKINFLVNNYDGKDLAFYTMGKRHQIALNDENKGTLELDLTKPSWARFSYMGDYIWLNLYLTPENDINVEIDVSQPTNGVPSRISVFTTLACNDGGINEYLLNFQKEISKSYIAPFKGKDNIIKGKAKVDRFDEIIGYYEEQTKNADLPEESKTAVNDFIKYSVAHSFMFFIYNKMRDNMPYHQDDEFYEKLNTLIVEDENLHRMKPYYEFIKGAVLRFYDRGESQPAEYYTQAIKRAKTFKINGIKDALIWQYAFECIKLHGVEGTEELQAVFQENFKEDPKAIEFFNGFIIKVLGLAKGQPSPTFSYKNTQGKEITLGSLKGKYIYIDLWATWCGPCKKEIPFLQKLEHDYANKNIQFVSISLDRPQDVERWKAMVKEKSMGGIQLHANGDENFANAYKVKGIPRFILLDKEGKIVDSNAPKPSSKQIRKTFDSLKAL